MPSTLYRLEFAGGPYDGLRAYLREIPDTRLLFPARFESRGEPIVAYTRIEDVPGAVYLFEHTCLNAGNGDAIPVMRFQFAGYTRPARAMGWGPWIGVAQLVCQCIRNWMTEPIAYPLQMGADDGEGVRPPSR